MRGRPPPLQALVSLARVDDADERKAQWRQALTFLGQEPRIDRPPPLDGLDVGSVLASCRAALNNGLVDDLEWISAEQALVALYELTTALPQGHERREFGKRVYQRTYGGPAAAFVAVAQRMAWSGVKQLETEPMRARVSLSLCLRIGGDVNVDPLAYALASGRDRFSVWVEQPSMGPLPQRRMAACILEKTAREAVRRAQNGDSYPVDWLMGPFVRPVYERLLADREPLVWRHVANARGILAAQLPELREEIELQLDPALSATQWRRAVVSLVACLSHDSETAFSQCQKLLRGDLVRKHPGLLSTVLWGLPPVIDADPDTAEALVELLVKEPRPDLAEELAWLRQEVKDPAFAAKAADSLASALGESSPADDPTLQALILQSRSRLITGPARVSAKALRALSAFESVGALQARDLAVEALEEAHATMTAIETAAQASTGLVGVFRELSDLGVSVLERARLRDMVLLGKRPGEGNGGVPPFDQLLERMGNWLLRSEQTDEALGEEWSPAETMIRRRRLVIFLHLLDTQSGQRADEHAAPLVRQRLRASLLTLMDRISEGPDATVHRVTCAALARSFDAAVREGMVDPADLLLLVIKRIEEPQSLRAITEGSTDQDMRHYLAAYDDFLTVVRGEEDAELYPGTTRSQRLTEAFLALSSALGDRGSYRGEALRQSLQRIGRALGAFNSALSLSELVAEESGSRDWADELERATDSLEALTYGATARVRGAKLRTRRTTVAPSGDEMLSRLVERQVGRGEGISQSDLDTALSALARTMPALIARPMVEVAKRLAKLPPRPTTERSVIPLKKRRTALPDWLLPRRTIGGFYVVRALGSGGVSTVFVAKRIEERKNERAETYALKIPHYDPTTARSLSEQEFLDMFREEAGALLSLPSHPNLSSFVNFDMSARPKPILVMELIRGQALERLLLQRTLTTEKSFALLDGILAGMGAMHAVGVAHLDLKPSNVILRDNGVPVLVDFGLSGRQLRPGCGTLEYCAPEVLGVIPEGYAPEAVRADIYAFACLAYELLTGELLFDAENETALMGKHVGHDGWPAPLAKMAEKPEYKPVAAILGACLRRDPRNRPTTDEVRSAFAKLRNRVDVSQWPWPLSAQASEPAGMTA